MPETWREARRIFEQALDRPTAERAGFARAAAGGDAHLLAEIEDLLRHAAVSGALLEPPAAPRLASAWEHAADELRAGKAVAGFRLVRRVASGGMGTVWEAEQESPRRRVALKTMRNPFGSPAARRRFQVEAEVLARLLHPNIAQVYASGVLREGGPEGAREFPWFAMEFVEGARDLVQHAAERGLDTSARVRLFRAVCSAVQHGHERGVLHRDLKPGNVLVDASGAPKLIDFGVARAEGLERTRLETQPGTLVGTLQYMAPEQLEGARAETDVRSDVYALGVVLYELLCGAPPYELAGRSLTEVARVVRDVAPRRPAEVGASLDRDLEAILFRALEKDRARRYGSAAALSADLERWLEHEPVEARPPTTLYQIRSLVRRHRRLVAAVAAVIVALALGLVGTGTGLMRARVAEAATKAERDAARLLAYVGNVAAADAALRGGDVADARRRLEQAPAELRGWEWEHLRRRLDRSVVAWRAHEVLCKPSWTPDGTCVVTISNAGAISAWDARTGAARWSALGERAVLYAVRWSPDGARLATVGRKNTVQVLDGATGTFVWRARAEQDWTFDACWSADGRRLYTTGNTGDVEVFDGETGERTAQHELGNVWINTLTEGGEGGLILARSSGPTLRWLRVDDRSCAVERTLTLPAPATGGMGPFAVLPDRKRLVHPTTGAWLMVVDLDTGQVVQQLHGHRESVTSLALSPDGNVLASGAPDRMIRLWNARTLEPMGVLLGHEGAPSVAFSPDSRWLASGDDLGWVRVWRVPTDDVIGVDSGWRWNGTIAFRPGGTRAWVTLFESLMDVDAAAGGVVVHRRFPGGRITCAAPSPDGAEVALGAEFGRIDVWDAALTAARLTIDTGPQAIAHLDFAPSGERLYAVHPSGAVSAWDARTGAPATERRTFDVGAHGLAVDTGGAWIAVGLASGAVCALSPEDLSVQRTLPPHAQGVSSLALSADGALLASGDQAGRIRVWGTRDWSLRAELTGHGRTVMALSFSPDGRRLASGGLDAAIKLWDVALGQEMATLRGHEYGIEALAFSPDGAHLVSRGADETLRFWDGPASLPRAASE